jgi:SAM-dependent methyltransferase
MDAEKLRFPANSFDIVFCGGVLHHLDIERAYQELSRVLRPEGEIICGEPLGYNPLIKWYRRRTPQMRTEWEAEHLLTLEDVDLAKRYFGKVETRFYYLASIAAVPFRNSRIFNLMLSGLEMVDDVLLNIPILQKQAWQIFFVLSKPFKANRNKGKGVES